MKNKKKKKLPIDRIQADPAVGLSEEEVKERTEKGYVNIATDPHEKSNLKIIAGNLFTFFNIVLLTIAMVFIGFIVFLNIIGRKDIVNSHYGFSKFVFLVPALMNVAMGSFQEIKSLKAIKKLRIVTSTKSRVIRNGETVVVDATEIVLDDIVAVSAGDQATADLTVLTGEVYVDESMLTGESDHVRKTVGDTILSGSSVMVGSARCRAEKTGDETYAAELTRKVKSGSRHKSELMTSIMKIIKILTVGLCIAAVVVTLTLCYKVSIHGNEPELLNGDTLSLDDPVTWSLIVLTDGMFGIGMIPSGLVLTTSVALMVSIAQLTKKKTLVQELYSLENLSRVDVICLDKTGTLTDGTMEVCGTKLFVTKEEAEHHARVLAGSVEERNATLEAIYQYFGAEKADISEAIPFSSENKYSGIVYKDGKKLLMGAPEYLISENDKRMSYVTEQAKNGNRVIAVTLDGELLAFISIADHIRDTASDTLKFFRENGVEVKVISGDNPLTVSIIAKKCGIENADKYISLAGVPIEDIPKYAKDYTIFARVSPEQKEALVEALQAEGHKVAMTGDGVNDILALRRADSSITFAKATEAAKSCSDVVLLDNDFSHMKEVVGEGRRVIGNIQKTAVLYLMKSTAVFILSLALIPLAKAHFWFSVENLYLLEAAVIGTGGFFISLEPRRTPVRGSFLKTIVMQSISAGVLSASAVLLPIMLNTVPKYFGYAPLVSDMNVKPMMTVLLSVSGIVVVFSMCIPFNKYRAFSLVSILFVASFLGMLVPSTYIGGKSIGPDMLDFNSEIGQTIFDSQLVQEIFHPSRSEVVRELFSDKNNYLVLQLFLYIAIPVFIMIRFAVENYTQRAYKKSTGNRGFRIGRRLMLSTSFVIMLHAVFTFTESAILTKSSLEIGDVKAVLSFTPILVVLATAQVAIGVIGYIVWKSPTKKAVNTGFIAGILLFLLTVAPMFITGTVISPDNPLVMTDNTIILLATALYIIGAVIVKILYDPKQKAIKA